MHKWSAFVFFLIMYWWAFAKVCRSFGRDSAAKDIPTQFPVTRFDAHVAQYSEESTNKQVTFRDPVSHSEMDYQDAEGNQNERDTSANWSSGNPPYTTTLDDPSSSYSPNLPPVLEEPSSSFSEGNESPWLKFGLVLLLLSATYDYVFWVNLYVVFCNIYCRLYIYILWRMPWLLCINYLRWLLQIMYFAICSCWWWSITCYRRPPDFRWSFSRAWTSSIWILY